MSATITLHEGLERLQLGVSLQTQQKLIDYLALVQKWNRVYNLTAVRDTDDMLTHHLFDSLAVVPHIDTEKTLLDVGSGAGLPGIPIALALPQTQVTLLDSNQKKAAFLNQAVIELQLGNVNVVCERVEKYQPKQLFSLVVSRAFSALVEYVAAAGRLVAPEGTLLAMKGMRPQEEMAQLTDRYQISRILPLAVPGLNAERHLIFLKAA